MSEKFHKCGICGSSFTAGDMCLMFKSEDGLKWVKDNKCRYCSHDEYFFSIAQYRIKQLYNLYSYECPKDLIDIEIIRAKTRYVLMGKDPKYVTTKNENMITNVTNSAEMRQALNENLHALLTKKRKLLVVKEVNNTLGKILMDVKMEIMQNAISGERNSISWFDRNIQSQLNGEKKHVKKIEKVA